MVQKNLMHMTVNQVTNQRESLVSKTNFQAGFKIIVFEADAKHVFR